MRALVTGGAGFVGSTLVDRLLAEGHQVDIVDDLSAGSLANLAEARRSPNRRLTFHQLDVCAPSLGELVRRCHPDVVYHLAGRRNGPASLTDPVADAEANIIGSLRVIEAARGAGAAKVVYLSDAAIYGEADPAALPLKESSRQLPLSPHAVARKAVVDYLAAYREVHSLEYTAIVPGHVYGPRQQPDGVVGRFARSLRAGAECHISGDGRQTRDFVYVDDVVDALARAAERGGGLSINAGTGVETSIAELHRLMAAQTGTTAPPVRDPERPFEIRRSCLDPGRAAIHLGWKPWTALAAGVRAYLEWLAAAGQP